METIGGNVKRQTAMWMLLLGILTSSVNVQGQSYVKDMQKLFKDEVAGGPYVYMQTPRSGFDVGATFIIVDKKFLVYSRPEDCFTKDLLNKVQDTIKLPTFKKDVKYSLDIGLKLLPIGPVTKDVEAEFKNKKVSSILMGIPELKSRAITISDLQKNLKNHTDKACGAEISGAKKRLIIIESLYAPKYKISFKDSQNKTASISGGILKVLFPKLSYDSEKQYQGEIDFEDEAMVVAYKAVKLKEALNFAADDTPNFDQMNDAEVSEYYSLDNSN